MATKTQAIRLAILVELLSLPVFFVQIDDMNVSAVLFGWFIILNFPTILLFHWHVWESYGGKTVFPFIVIPIIAIQGIIWFCIWFGLLTLFKKISKKWRNK